MPGKTDLPVEDDDEFYVDVEQAPPARPPRVPTSTSTPAKSIPASTTAAKRGSSPSTPTKFTSSYTPAKQSSSPSTPSKLSSSFTPSKPSPPPTAHTGSPVAQRAATKGRGAKPLGAEQAAKLPHCLACLEEHPQSSPLDQDPQNHQIAHHPSQVALTQAHSCTSHRLSIERICDGLGSSAF